MSVEPTAEVTLYTAGNEVAEIEVAVEEGATAAVEGGGTTTPLSDRLKIVTIDTVPRSYLKLEPSGRT